MERGSVDAENLNRYHRGALYIRQINYFLIKKVVGLI